MREVGKKMSGRLPSILLQTVALSCSCLMAGCGSRANKETQERNEAGIKQLKEFQTTRESRLKELKAMDLPGLASELEKESRRGLEPFNSMAYAETVSRGEKSAAILAPLLTKSDRGSFLGFLALRKLDAARYRSLAPDFRTAVLLNALETSAYFNAWGIPTLYWTDAAKAIIEEGVAVQPGLARLLRDTRAAPVWGSEGVMVNQQYHFRVEDYAWTLLNEIRNERVEISQNPEERDKLIAETLKRVAPRQK
jgi:hypothetical protein